ncbi:MAG: hypothetical protein PF694_06315 [Bacteroidetes bacterium]|jgi:hypothetical protein|nr:hypothetical protein [Bacteroidota bacterium]
MKISNLTLYVAFALISLNSCKSIEKVLKQANTTQLSNELDKKDPNYIQNKGKEREEEELEKKWPPKNPNYTDGSLGFQLNDLFKSFAMNSGLTQNENRDFIPKPVANFVGEGKLSQSSELADISGKGLFFYVFTNDDRIKALNSIIFNNNVSRKINVPGYSSFDLKVDDDLDNFLITSTARGYIDASIEGGIKPPFTSIKVAGQKEKEQKTALMAVYGSFESPIIKKINTETEILLTLWDVYKINPTLIDNAFYLKEFNGVISRVTTSNSEYNKLAGAGVLNYSGPVGLKLKAKLEASKENKSIFNATDWNTYVNVQGLNEQSRKDLFISCPSIEDIQRHFTEVNSIRIDNNLFVKDFPDDHKISFFVKGIPTDYIGDNIWKITSESNNLEANPQLTVTEAQDKGATGAIFTFTCNPNTSIFNTNFSSVDVFFDIEATNAIYYEGKDFKLTKRFSTPVTLNTDPKIDYPEVIPFEPYSILGTPASSEKFVKWTFDVEIKSDEANPVRFQSGIVAKFENIIVKNSNNEIINVNIDINVAGGSKKAYSITIMYLGERVDYNNIDFSSGENYSFEGDLKIPLEEGVGANTIRPISVVLKYPVKKIVNNGDGE